MKYRNNWRVRNKQWDKFQIKVRLGKIDFFAFELDLSRKFVMLTITNLTLKNR
jgi:hypothetical protein